MGDDCRKPDREPDRQANLQAAVRLEVFTIGWNIVEGVIAVTAALLAGSVALLGFGVDSFVESTSGAVLLWRLLAERRGADSVRIEELDRRAHRLVGLSLFLLAAFVVTDATYTLATAAHPSPSIVGIVLTSVSLAIMMWLARAKRRAAGALRSRALEADAFQTTACWWLSLIALGGMGLNAGLGWWWADPAAAIAMCFFLVREGREAWRGETCCD